MVNLLIDNRNNETIDVLVLQFSASDLENKDFANDAERKIYARNLEKKVGKSILSSGQFRLVNEGSIWKS